MNAIVDLVMVALLTVLILFASAFIAAVVFCPCVPI